MSTPIITDKQTELLVSTINIPKAIFHNDENGDVYSIVYNGKGEIKFKDGSYYKGEVLNGNMHGMGTYIYPDGTKISMKFHFNQFTGLSK